jgi:hypothetical protein
MAHPGAVEKLRVFISHSRTDSAAFAEELAAALEIAGFAPFLDNGEMTTGWDVRLGGLIEYSDAVVFVISPEAVKSERVLWEVDRTIELSKPLLPIIFKPVPGHDIPEKLRDLQFVRFDTGKGVTRPIAKLADALRMDLEWIREHRWLGQLAMHWDGRGRPESPLLRGDDLKAAKKWMAGRKVAAVFAPEITEVQRAFIEVSEEAEAVRLAGDRRTSPLAKVFISYRREDSKWPARQLYNSFLRHLPRGQVFIDIDSIPPGADFVEILEHQVEECEIVLALIGPGWIGNTDAKTGQRRLDNPKDFVRIEICAALSRDIPVVPVLLDGTPMPEVDQLPEDMRMLTRKQAEIVAYNTFETDVDRLIRRLGLSKAKDVTDPNTAD